MVRKSVEQNEKQAEKRHVVCLNCRQSTRHVILHSTNVTWEYTSEIVEWTSYEIVQCCGCDEISFCKVDTASENLYYDEREGKMELWSDVEVFPPRLTGQQGLKEEDILYHLPLNVQRIYRETYKALCNQQPILAGVGVRALVEAVCNWEKASGKNLKERIDDLAQQGFITVTGANMLQNLRIVGNKAAHEIKPHRMETLSTAFEIVEHVLKSVYVYPDKAEHLQEKERVLKKKRS